MPTAVRSPIRDSVTLGQSDSLPGDLVIPPGATSLIIFAHGSGSSRRSPRNQWVAGYLQEAGFATLLFDLLTDAESLATELRFDIPLLARRLGEATAWAATHASTHDMRVGYFGASTGAAAALVAASVLPGVVRAVVSRGGRPDLAGDALPSVVAPTRLIVGELDGEVIALNQSALRRMRGATKDLVIVPGASHLFEERGTLQRAAELARDWFRRYVASDPVVSLDDEC